VIGLFGGTFDPIHLGHLRLAEELREALDLTEVRFLPAYEPPHRDTPQGSSMRRLQLVEAAIANNPAFVLDKREYERGGRSYTVDTLHSLREELGEQPLVLIMGMDAFNGFTRWHRWEEILRLAHLGVATRPGAELQAEATALLERHSMAAADMRQTPAGGICQVPISQLDISATRIRELLRAKRSVRYLVPDTVRMILEKDGL